MTDTTTTWGEIEGREITFPMEVTDFDAATLLYSVPAGAAAALLPGDAFEVVEVGARRGPARRRRLRLRAQPVG